MARASISYPRAGGDPHLLVGLEDIRAADDIRISYDFERDGWVVEQAAVFEWDANDPTCDPDWGEVAFVPAWGRAREANP